MQHPDEGMIHTWLDGELSAEDAAALEAHVADCPECAAAVADARGLIAGSSRIVSSLDSVPGGVIPAVRPARRAWFATTQFRAAAVLLLVAGTSFAVIRKNAGDGDTVVRVAAPRTAAKDAISRQPSAGSAAPAKPAAPQPITSPRGLARSSSSAVAASPPADQPRTESPLNRVMATGMAGARGIAVQPTEPKSPMQDSAAFGAVTENGVGGNTLTLIRTDSMSAMTRRVFQTRSGVQLIMTESNEPGFSAAAQSGSAKTLSVSPRAAIRAATTLPAAPAPSTTYAKDQVKLPNYRSITWVDAASGHSYSLSGPFPPDQLEKFKEVVVKLSR